MRKFVNYTTSVILALIVIPTLIVLLYKVEQAEQIKEVIQEVEEEIKKEPEKPFFYIFNDEKKVEVYNPEIEIIQDIGIEEYIKGVVAAEMPALFEMEALKAQAVAARTYALKKIQDNEDITEAEIGQAFLSKEELKERWGKDYNTYFKRISKAVDETRNEVMMYDDEMIDAVFHSTSSGYTENSENVWSVALPYLQGVESKNDEKAPDFITEKVINSKEVISKLQNKYKDLKLTNIPLFQQIQIIERSQAGYILQIQIGNKIITGKEMRELLELKSSNFTISQNNNELIFITKGYGHGAGMSQYGANFMAQEGSTYEEILKHYYKGIKITKYSE